MKKNKKIKLSSTNLKVNTSHTATEISIINNNIINNNDKIHNNNIINKDVIAEDVKKEEEEITNKNKVNTSRAEEREMLIITDNDVNSVWLLKEVSTCVCMYICMYV